jgi:hypothetical protein
MMGSSTLDPSLIPSLLIILLGICISPSIPHLFEQPSQTLKMLTTKSISAFLLRNVVPNPQGHRISIFTFNLWPRQKISMSAYHGFWAFRELKREVAHEGGEDGFEFHDRKSLIFHRNLSVQIQNSRKH